MLEDLFNQVLISKVVELSKSIITLKILTNKSNHINSLLYVFKN